MADDLRKIPGTPGAAGAAGRDNKGPVPADARKSANASAPGAPKPDVLAGLDAFSRRVDEEQKAHERAEAERRRAEEEAARRKAEAERARQAQVEAQRRAEAENQSGGRRFSALEMLRKQAASRPVVDDGAARRAAARPLIHKNLLASLHFLAEFAKEINAMLPSTESGYGFIYLQQSSRKPSPTTASARSTATRCATTFSCSTTRATRTPRRWRWRAPISSTAAAS